MTLDDLIRQQQDWLKTIADAAGEKPEAAAGVDADALQLAAACRRADMLARGRELAVSRLDRALERERGAIDRLERAVAARKGRTEEPAGKGDIDVPVTRAATRGRIKPKP